MGHATYFGQCLWVRWLGFGALALALTTTTRHGECQEATENMTEYENQLARIIHQSRDKWQQLAARGSIPLSDIDREAVATDLAGMQHDMMWRPGFLNDVTQREMKRALEEEGREISREEARRKALAEQRPKPIPGHEEYSSLEEARAAANELRTGGEQGISVEHIEKREGGSEEAAKECFSVCQNINTDSENINAKLNYKLNGTLTSAYVDATVEYLQELIGKGGPLEETTLPEDLGTLQGKLVHAIWMEENRWELTYNVFSNSDALRAKFQDACGTADAEQVEVDKIVEFVSGLDQADYESLDAGVTAKLLQFRPYDDIGRREQVKDDIVGMQAVLLILNGLD